jgi:amino acid adenylation domain-containing protein
MPDASYVFPVSFAQQRLWFLDRMAPGNPFYNIPLAVPIRTALDVGALERALNAIVARHESLRTTFQVIDGEPCQVVHQSIDLKVSVSDLRNLPPAEMDARSRELATEDARRPFDLERGPLLRCTVLTRGTYDHILLLSMHHIVSDGWSMGILTKEVTALYQGFILSYESPLPELPIQYADFAVWQRDWLRGEVLDEQLSYWRKQLADLPTLELPTDRPRPPAPTFRGGFQLVRLPVDTSRKIRALARARGATPFMVLVAGFAVLLQRYSGQEDIVVGTPVANRNRAEIEGLIGFFVNSLVLRFDLTGNPTFTELLRRVHDTAVDGYAHQDLPFEKLVGQLQPVRDPSRNPLFQVTMQLVNAPTLENGVGKTESAGMNIQRGSAIFDIAYTLMDGSESFSGMIEYSTDLFDAATIEQMARHFERILGCIMINPEIRIGDIPLISSAECDKLIRMSHGAVDGAFESEYVHLVIREQAAKTPNAVAVEDNGVELTYRELDRRASDLATRLWAQVNHPDSRVAILMNRSPNLVAALLAVLHAGASYVPLDPRYPVDRLRYMVADSGARILLTDAARRDLAVSLASDGVRVVCVDSTDVSAALPPPRVDLHPEKPAYILYTSGSTGSPKGVAIPHRALANHMLWMLQRFPFTHDDRILQRTACSFDASVWEFFAPLMAGARVVLLPIDAQRDPQGIVSCLAKYHITTVQFVPSLLRAILDEPELYTCTSLRRIFSGGEALTEEMRELIKRSLDVEIINLYGPTEATIDAAYYVCGDRPEPLGVPIGHPITNLSGYVLDARLDPVPIGVAGELYLAGTGLASGYVNQPALTAQRFLPDPYGTIRGGRMYRSGDLVRRMSDGSLLYIGRVDEQVKVRGYRVELGEIETAIRRVPGVKACAVALEEGSGGVSLTAYIVLPSSEAARTHDVEALTDASAELVSRWEGLYEQIYSSLPANQNSNVSFVGWNSSYTGGPIPTDEMREWLEATVERIRALRPTRVLEIGCGTGLLLTRLAPETDHYAGSDFSRSVMHYLEHRVQFLPNRGENVELIHRRADEMDDLPEHAFPVVVLNSVLQYFPDFDYLYKVLRGAARLVALDGKIFIGDVRNLALLEAFVCSKILRKESVSHDAETFLTQVSLGAEEEEELLVDPRLFYAIADEFGATAEIHLKRGRHFNELTRYRYDVVLQMNTVSERAQCRRIDWQRDRFTMNRVRSMLNSEQPLTLIVEGIPNNRVIAESALLEKLKGAPRQIKLNELIAEARQAAQVEVCPEDFWQEAAVCGYDARIAFSEHPTSACFDVIFTKPGAPSVLDPAAEHARGIARQIWPQYVNNPLRSLVKRRLVTRVKEALAAQVPDYMVPSAFVLLDALPLLPNGKLNRKALVGRQTVRCGGGAYVAPRTALEQALARIWAEVLQLDRVGIRDDFFAELGGHSLLATQLISRVRDGLSTNASLQEVFRSPTVELFAAALADGGLEPPEQLEARAALLVNTRSVANPKVNGLFSGTKVMHA